MNTKTPRYDNGIRHLFHKLRSHGEMAEAVGKGAPSVYGALSGDKFSTLQYFHTLAMQLDMIWIGLGEMPSSPTGESSRQLGGAMAQATPESPDARQNIAKLLSAEKLRQSLPHSRYE